MRNYYLTILHVRSRVSSKTILFTSLIKDHIRNDKALHIFITFDDAILAIIAPLLLNPNDDDVEETQVMVSKIAATPTRFLSTAQ